MAAHRVRHGGGAPRIADLRDRVGDAHRGRDRSAGRGRHRLGAGVAVTRGPRARSPLTGIIAAAAIVVGLALSVPTLGAIGGTPPAVVSVGQQGAGAGEVALSGTGLAPISTDGPAPRPVGQTRADGVSELAAMSRASVLPMRATAVGLVLAGAVILAAGRWTSAGRSAGRHR